MDGVVGGGAFEEEEEVGVVECGVGLGFCEVNTSKVMKRIIRATSTMPMDARS